MTESLFIANKSNEMCTYFWLHENLKSGARKHDLTMVGLQ